MITDELYTEVKRELKRAKEPMTCNDLVDKSSIQQLEDVNTEDVSNALAALWRRGLLQRFSVNRAHGRGPRYGYMLRSTTEPPAFKAAAQSVNVANLDVATKEDGSVVLTTDRMTITIRPNSTRGAK